MKRIEKISLSKQEEWILEILDSVSAWQKICSSVATCSGIHKHRQNKRRENNKVKNQVYGILPIIAI